MNVTDREDNVAPPAHHPTLDIYQPVGDAEMATYIEATRFISLEDNEASRKSTGKDSS